MSRCHRSVLFASVIFVAIGAAGCERDRPEPPAPSEADAPWKTLVAELDGDRLTVHEKLRALDEFTAQFPDDHPYEDELARRRRDIERAVEADLAAQASRARANQQEEDAVLDRRRDAIATGPLAAVTQEVLFRFWPWEDDVSEDGFDAVTLAVDGRPPRVRRAPFRGSGLGTLRHAATELLGELFPEAVREGEYLQRHDRLNESLNQLLRGRLGTDLFDEANPGALDPAALEKLLDDIYVSPDAPFIGARAGDVYRLFRPIVWDYARVHQVLDRKFGRKKLVAMYRRALRTHDSSSYETTMLRFYGDFVTKHDVAKRAGLDDDWTAPVIAGFWMRRADDGTDRILVDFLRKAAGDYDPELAKLLARD